MTHKESLSILFSREGIGSKSIYQKSSIEDTEITEVPGKKRKRDKKGGKKERKDKGKGKEKQKRVFVGRSLWIQAPKDQEQKEALPSGSVEGGGRKRKRDMEVGEIISNVAQDSELPMFLAELSFKHCFNVLFKS
jgi:hypothetical protein